MTRTRSRVRGQIAIIASLFRLGAVQALVGL